MTTFAKLEKDFVNNVMGYSALGIILSTCLGSVAIMTTLMHGHEFAQMSLVMLTVMVCSLHNAAILTVQKPKLILNLLIFSVIINTLLIIVNGVI